MNDQAPATLRTGNYTIELGGAGCTVFRLEGDSSKVFICGRVPDPELAMMIIEGLILVENKRFYYPESTPTMVTEHKDPTPAFLKRS